MKHIFIILLALFSYTAFSQCCDATADNAGARCIGSASCRTLDSSEQVKLLTVPSGGWVKISHDYYLGGGL